MNLVTLIEKLEKIYEEYGNISVVCPGDHQEDYKVEFVSVEHIQEGECGGGYTVIHPDDLDEHDDPEMVVSIS
jgi:hypothetical protein